MTVRIGNLPAVDAEEIGEATIAPASIDADGATRTVSVTIGQLRAAMGWGSWTPSVSPHHADSVVPIAGTDKLAYADQTEAGDPNRSAVIRAVVAAAAARVLVAGTSLAESGTDPVVLSRADLAARTQVGSGYTLSAGTATWTRTGITPTALSAADIYLLDISGQWDAPHWIDGAGYSALPAATAGDEPDAGPPADYGILPAGVEHLLIGRTAADELLVAGREVTDDVTVRLWHLTS